MRPDVISIGEPLIEFCAVDIGRLSIVNMFKRGWGGDTSNFAVAAARTGSSSTHICRLGDDEFGRSFLELWRREGMDTSRVIVENDAWTAIYIISLIEGGGHDFTYYRKGSAASRFSLKDLDEEYVSGAKVLHFSGISLAVSKSLREACFRAMNLCSENGGKVSLDVNMRSKLWSVEEAKENLESAFKAADIVFASMEDVNTLYGLTETPGAAERLRSFGVETAVIKMGAKGCYVSSDNEKFTCSGYRVKPIDTTGSGDAFDGAWITATLEDWDLIKRAKFANAVGAITATGFGAVAPIPTKEQALRLMKEQDEKY
jgi:2-dehydro-3-deoxygluconokinase